MTDVFDLPDDRDYPYEFNAKDVVPEAVSLQPYIGGIEDQMHIGSCTANAVVSACECYLQAGGKSRDLSRLFNYYTSRELSGPMYLSRDGGSRCREAVRSAAKFGLPDEKVWPYAPNYVNTKPSPQAYIEAGLHKISRYERISLGSITGVKHALASGFPVVASFWINERFLTVTSEVAPPVEKLRTINNSDLQPYGEHAVLVIGYEPGAFTVENSWGSGWGVNGIGRIHEDFIRFSVDLWVVRGFDGIERCGANLVTPAIQEPIQPVPEPAAIPEPEPIREPIRPLPAQTKKPNDLKWYAIAITLTAIVAAVYRYLTGAAV